MARTVSVTKESLLEAGIRIAKTEGSQGLTARKLAAEAGCSTQPIFRVYKSMDELSADVFDLAAGIFSDYCDSFEKTSDIPFVDLGLAYITFAQNNKELFKMLFVSDNRYGRSLMELLNGNSGFLKEQIAKAASGGCRDCNGLFMKMWMLIHGSACMSLTGDYDLDIDATRKLLEEAERALG